MEQFTQGKNLCEETGSLKKAIGASVITPHGAIIGTVSDIRVNTNTLQFEGIIVSQGFLDKSIFISKDYISKISADSLILSVELLTLLFKKQVITYQGELIGSIKDIERVHNSNEFTKIIVKPKKLFKKEFTITPSDIKSIGESIILKEKYNVEN